MTKLHIGIAAFAALVALPASAEQLVFISGSLMAISDGMGGENNTLQIGKAPPVPLSIGSSLMIAEYGAQEFVFSLRL